MTEDIAMNIIVFPAPAGVILSKVRNFIIGKSFPRTCGGDPCMCAAWTMKHKVFPAPAGVIPVVSRQPLIRICFPRTCGGDPLCTAVLGGHTKFSPHLRG